MIHVNQSRPPLRCTRDSDAHPGIDRMESPMNTRLRLATLATLFLGAAIAVLAWPSAAPAMPAFARQYQISCAMCHNAFPRLNGFGEYFAGNNMRLPQ